jgi:hypothetical protein
MTGPDNGQRRFSVSMSKKVATHIKDILERATDDDFLDDYLAALLTIQKRLERDPDVFGEPRFHLNHLDIQLRIAIVRPLSVTFGVNAEKRLVFIARIRDIRQGGFENS